MSRTEEFAKAVQPLPMEEGLYYRSHPKGRPFSRADASTKPIGEAPSESLAKYWVPKEGYSSFWNPHHVEEYHDAMNWGMKGRRVIAFRGHAVGEGLDGEPRVLPDSDKPEFSLSPRQFHERLDVTENGYGRYNDHTWGDGPKGQQVDDGYRTFRNL